MQKQAVLRKLALVRLAINHVLRNRMIKKATENDFPQMIYPGDPGYDPHLGVTAINGNPSYKPGLIYQPYNKLNPPKHFLDRYPLRKTMQDLTPRTVSNPATNPYFNKDRVQSYPREEQNHIRLFGVPSLQWSNHQDEIDRAYNGRLLSNDAFIDVDDYERSTLKPAKRAYQYSLGFPDTDADRSRMGLYFPPDKTPFYVSTFPTLDLPIKTDARGDYISTIAFDEDDEGQIRRRRLFDLPVFSGARPLGEAYLQAKDTYDQLYDNALMADSRYHASDMSADELRKHHNKLMHSYINQSPVGKAFRAYPSLITGVPYAAYHAMPYATPSNRPDWVNNAINGVINAAKPRRTTPTYREKMEYEVLKTLEPGGLPPKDISRLKQLRKMYNFK